MDKEKKEVLIVNGVEKIVDSFKHKEMVTEKMIEKAKASFTYQGRFFEISFTLKPLYSVVTSFDLPFLEREVYLNVKVGVAWFCVKSSILLY
jgi:hypothetical protein